LRVPVQDHKNIKKRLSTESCKFAVSKPNLMSDRRKRKDDHSSPEPDMIRLNRFISNSGVCSRRDADTLIKAGEIKVDGKVVTALGTRVSVGAVVEYKGRRLNSERKVYILLNKPRGYVTTLDDPHAEKKVIDLVKRACPERVYPVGRLDKDTTGVLLFTNDGELTKKLTHPSHRRKKIYHVFLNKALTKNDMIKLTSGVDIGEIVKADSVAWPDPDDKSQAGIEIHSGQNRVVRRMFESLGYRVKKLDRVYFAGLTKKNLPRGKWRFLTESEVNILKRGK
jgi:23S rRNA pseudouridine2605 synthase